MTSASLVGYGHVSNHTRALVEKSKQGRCRQATVDSGSDLHDLRCIQRSPQTQYHALNNNLPDPAPSGFSKVPCKPSTRAHRAGAYRGFCSKKQMRVLLLPCGNTKPVHIRVFPSSISAVSISTPGWRETTGSEVPCLSWQREDRYGGLFLKSSETFSGPKSGTPNSLSLKTWYFHTLSRQ